MALRGKVSVYTIFLVMAIGTIGLLSFQDLKERKNSTMLLIAKNKKIDDLKNQYVELLEATKTTLMQIKVDKESLIHKVKDLEDKNMIYHTSCKHDKEKCENEKNKEVQDIREILQTRGIEILKANTKIDQLKLDNKKGDKKKDIKLVLKNSLLEKGLEQFIGTTDNMRDQTIKKINLQNLAKSDKVYDVESNVEERNAPNERDLEDKKNPKVKKNVTNLGERNLIATTVNGEEDNNVKEFEIEMKKNKSYAQE